MSKIAFCATNGSWKRRAYGTWNDEWEEWTVRFFKDGVYQKDADYHTDDREDAIATAHYWVDNK